MKRAYWKDIWRAISKGKKRFLCIALIVTLGVTMMCGLRASCEDLRYSADKFFDEQKLFDIRIFSTLGLTEEDVKALEELDEVEEAEGGYHETARTMVDGIRKSMEVRALSKNGINAPYLLEGEMPAKANEIVVTKTYKNETGKTVGDTIKFVETSDALKNQEYQITGIIIDAMDINSTEGSMGFRSTATTDYVGYVLDSACDYDIYTVLYLRMQGLNELDCYSDAYSAKVDGYVKAIEDKIKQKREEARYQEIYDEAMGEWKDGEAEMLSEFAKADAEIADAREELADGKKKLQDARKELQDAERKIKDGKAELNSQEKEAEKAFAEAWQDIADGYEAIAAGEVELEKGYAELTDGQKQLDEGKAELERQEAFAKEQFADAWEQIRAGEAELQAGIEEYESMKQMLDSIRNLVEKFVAEMKALIAKADISDDVDALIRESMSVTKQYLGELEASVENAALPAEFKGKLEGAIADVKAYLPKLESLLHTANIFTDVRDIMNGLLDELLGMFSLIDQELAAGAEQIEAGKQQLEAGKAELIAQEALAEEEFTKARQTIEENQKKIDDGMAQYYEGLEELVQGKKDLEEGEAQLRAEEKSARDQIAKAKKEISDGLRDIQNGWKEVFSGEEELLDGEATLNENVEEYHIEKAKAEKDLADALEEINDIDMTKWYVQDRNSLSGFSNLAADADSIQAIGDIFPVLFLIVAILISLTTITRMVEEERGLIGTYKALGFSNAEIRRKYLLYAALACFIGGIIGDIAGYIILPYILFIVFHIMYTIPEYFFQFDALFGFGGILFFELGVVGATAYSCSRALRQMPAKLMRPKAPKAGSRVLLERITFVWKRLSFLNKVTARNLFRYKKRLFMTVFGIAGCTALLLCGFTIKDTVSEMLPQQYQYIYKYDLMVVTDEEDYEEVTQMIEEDGEVSKMLPLRIESVDMFNEDGKALTVQLMVVPDGEVLDEYIYLRRVDKKPTALKPGEVILTKNATRVLDLEIGDYIKIQNLDLEEAETNITQIVDNYFGNVIYLTESTYEDLFESFAVNGMLAQFSDTCTDQSGYTDALAREEMILAANSTEAMEAEFHSAFTLLNMVVYVILVLAAMLAFTVLFTLSNTNISERERELATIKVLGFYHPEVHAYVNKETWILTSIGIVVGMPLGWLLGRYVMGILELPSLEFFIALYPKSYVFAAAITVIFAFVVNSITDKTLDKINMVEALKSVE